MNLKLYLVLFSIAESTILLLNSDAVAQVKADNSNIYRQDGNNFQLVPGWLKEISIGNKDNVWRVNENKLTGFGGVFKYDGNKFVQVPGALSEVYVGADGSVSGLNYTSREVWKYDGNNFVNFGDLDKIAVGNKDNV